MRAALIALAAIFALLQTDDGCGAVTDPEKGEGEACTRTSECRFPLECRGGVCRSSSEPFDAGPGMDAGRRDAGDEDAGAQDADVMDADLADGDVPEAGVDAGDADAGDAGDSDAGDSDAGETDAGA